MKRWAWIHKWSSVVCTAFLLLLCVTGLPLIFHHEIDEWTESVEYPPMPEGAPSANLDDVLANAKQRKPEFVAQYLVWDADEPREILVNLAPSARAETDSHLVTVDGLSGKVVHEGPADEGFMYVMFKLHVDLFAGLPGKLFLGLMGILFAAAIVSGIVLYAPFMRRLDFGDVRRGKSTRVKWLDLHNLLGVVTIAWALVVGLTGVINTWADLVIKFWQYDQLTAMVAPYKGQPAPKGFGSLQAAVETARKAAPDMIPSFVAFPGTIFSSEHHYAVFMRGHTALTKRLVKPVLVDAQTAKLTDTRDLPWYVTALLVSQPLHFGDYGGLPFKIVWALLDVVTIVVLGSGLYLWLARRRKPGQQDEAEWKSAMAPVEGGEATP
ncbi:MAG TPA: PepSY-associated TM helix domain-containing protein [Burkholderiales bacterium]|nr:PepSY-associated TM helix domain-containing protein [Burkholderiales bacterium]